MNFSTANHKQILLLLIAIAVFIGLIIFLSICFTSGEPLFDFTAFWIAGRLTLDGKDPYSAQDWIPVYEPYDLGLADNQTFLYPKPILPLFLPFGFLELRTASILWLILTQLAILGSIIALSRIRPKFSMSHLLPLIIGIFLFRSYLVTLSLGQLGGVLILILTIAILLWKRSNWIWGGIIFSLIAIKPPLGFPLIILTSIWFLKNKLWQYFYGIAIGGALMLSVGWFFDLHWISKFIEIGTNKVAGTFGYHPTIWGLAGFLCNHQSACTYLIGGIFTSIFFMLYLWFLLQRKYQMSIDILICTAITYSLLLTPYLWVYDQILLIIPLVIIIGKMINQGYPYLSIASLPTLISVVSLILLPVAIHLQNDVLNVFLPILMLGVIYLAVKKEYAGV